VGAGGDDGQQDGGKHGEHLGVRGQTTFKKN
jgi:hypothetical protein